MLNSLTATDVAILAGVFIAVRLYFDLRTARKQPDSAPAPTPQLLEDFATRLATLETAVRGLPSLWSTEVARATEQADLIKRSAARLEQANRRAEAIREERDNDGGGLPVVTEVHSIDGARGGEGQLPPVRANVAAPSFWSPPHKRTMGR